ncbi:MAG TPA: thioredoxin [Bacteroidales bacterium]|nr:thioredoxin [Bacteroidales bacterium]
MKNAPAVAESELIEHLTAQNFAHKTKNGVVLVDFWADWCMPCKMMAPILNEVAEATDGTATIYKLNVDEQQQVAAQFGIRSIPTMILFKDGKEMERIIGVKSKEAVIASINKAK